MFKAITQKIRMLFFILFTFSINGFGNNNAFPVTCTYTLELMDALGDGWDGGGFLTVSINGNSSEYTLTSGSMETYTFDAEVGDNIVFTYSLDYYNSEVSYNILNPNGDIIFSDGPNPKDGLVFQTTGCTNCPGIFDLEISNNLGTSAEVNWQSSSTADGYEVIYGITGFTIGGSGSNSTSDLTLSNLTEFTTYDVYVQSICGFGNEYNVTGPLSFTTAKVNDVGLLAINAPNTKCNLGDEETIVVTLTNYGLASQSSIPFGFSVNGVVASSNIPSSPNTIQTGEEIIIDLTEPADFSQLGTYEIAAWTELNTDVDNENDTVYLTIKNLPYISDFPHEEDFENNTGYWSLGLEGQNQTFALGQPIGNDISNAASGINAWVTNLSGNYENNELSYLESNCLDFSNYASDPTISFSINFETENFFDGAWLEVSINGNEWTKVGTAGTGSNWYNGSNNLGEAWAGNSEGWIIAQNELTGTAGESDIRLRFGFYSDGSFTYEGVGIDNIFIEGEVPTDELNFIEQIDLYPNPTSDIARLNMAFSQVMDVEIQLTNAIGQVVFETFKTNILQNQVELNLQNYPAGIFYVKVKAGDQVRIKKLIKN